MVKEGEKREVQISDEEQLKGLSGEGEAADIAVSGMTGEVLRNLVGLDGGHHEGVPHGIHGGSLMCNECAAQALPAERAGEWKT